MHSLNVYAWYHYKSCYYMYLYKLLSTHSITIIHLILCCNSIRMVLPAVLYSNRAQCHLNKSDWQSALNDCNEAMARCLEGQLQYLFLQSFDNVSVVPFLLWWIGNNYPHYQMQGHLMKECFQSTVFLYSEIFKKPFFSTIIAISW